MDTDRLQRLIGEGRHAQAIDEARNLIRSGQGSAAVYAALAEAARRLGRFEAAAAAMREVAALSPDDPQAWLELGELLSLTARWSEALRALRLACDLASPADMQPWIALAGAQLASQRAADAERTVAAMRERFPSAPECHVMQAALDRSFGRPAQALAAYHRALALDPLHAPALLALAELDGAVSAITQRIRVARASPGRSPEQRVQLEFALARVLDRQGHVDEAMQCFVAANAMQRQSLAGRGIVCPRRELSAWTEAARTRFSRAVEAVAPSWADRGFAPIFILGMPRSGTTLVERILAAHPHVAAGGELATASVVYTDYLRARSRLRLGWPADPCDEVERGLLADARERYVEQVIGLAGQALFLTDKHPGNAPIAGFLHMVFPESPIVRVRRDSLATCWSLFTSYLPASSACFTDQEDIAHYHSCHDEVMRYWAEEAGVPVHEVAYESLVSDPEAGVRALLSGCSLSWSESCLHPERTPGAVTSASVDQVRAPIHRDAIARHRRYERHLGRLQELLRWRS